VKLIKDEDDERKQQDGERGWGVVYEPLAQGLLPHVDARNGNVQGHDVHMPEVLPHLYRNQNISIKKLLFIIQTIIE